MNRKVLLFVPIVVAILALVYFQSLETEKKQSEVKKIEGVPITQNFEIDEKSSTSYDLEMVDDSLLFRVYGKEGEDFMISEDGSPVWASAKIFPKAELQEIYDEVGVRKDPQNTVVIYPIFTSSAYKSPGFYDYYSKRCDEKCLTTKIEVTLDSTSSGVGIQVLALLGYEIVNDLYVDKNPEKLKDYDKVIVLHNEYVTKTEFDAITNHPKVVYLYPNANYAEVKVDYEAETITLIRGHGYQNVSNAFGWEFDNTPQEYDKECKNWEFYQIDNGIMLNCEPESLILVDKEFLKAIKEY